MWGPTSSTPGEAIDQDRLETLPRWAILAPLVALSSEVKNGESSSQHSKVERPRCALMAVTFSRRSVVAHVPIEASSKRTRPKGDIVISLS